MTAVGDLCPCGDLALPGHDLCAGCAADVQAARSGVAEAARAVTAEHERQVIEDEERAA